MLPFFRGCKYLTTKPRKLITAIDYFPKILTFASNPGIIIPHSHPTVTRHSDSSDPSDLSDRSDNRD